MDQATPSSSGKPKIAEADGKDPAHLDAAVGIVSELLG